ncbi:MAG: cell wall hydrolase [Lachnospiraceae bacterium]|nr:cell wall hydrolase [Lachnospiraceae bacterium]
MRQLTEMDAVLGPADTGLAQARRPETPDVSELSENESENESENQGNPGWVVEISQEDYTALLKLVEAETSGEDIKGRMLVANVVLNRLETGRFGASVKEVIYQRVDGRAQFSPVGTGKIERVVVSPETVEAVERVLCGEDESQGALYFAARAHANPKNMAWFDRNLTRLFAYHGHEFFI